VAVIAAPELIGYESARMSIGARLSRVLSWLMLGVLAALAIVIAANAQAM
jgi:hypothetical protein